MSISRLSGALLSLALGSSVPALEVNAIGTVVIDSGTTVAVNAPAKELLLSWRRSEGAMVRPGEVLLRFDTTLVERQLLDRRRGAEIARLEHEKLKAQRAGELASLEAERRTLQAELAVVRASIELAEEQDPQRLGLLKADLEAARLAADIASREAGRTRVAHDLGQASAADAENADRAAARSQQGITRPELALAQQEHPTQTPVELAALRLKQEDLTIRLGLKEDGSEDPALGIGGRITAARAQGEADVVARRLDLERIEAELKESERDVLDRTALISVEVSSPGVAESLAKVRFLPEGRSPAKGWTADHGAVFANGMGWDRTLTEAELVWREPAVQPQAMAGEGAPRPPGDKPRGSRKRTGPGASSAGGAFSGGLALLAAPAQWSLAVPPGRYSVTVSLGDDRSWDGAAVLVEGQPLPLPARIGPGRSEQRIEVQVDDGRLDLRVADGETKAVRAEKGGTLVLQGQASVGFRVNDPSWSLGFLAAPESRVIDLLVPQEMALLLAPTRKPAADGPLVERIALQTVRLRRHDGSLLTAQVVSVGAQNVRNERGDRAWDGGNPADAIAREVRLRPDPAQAQALVQGETLDVLFDFTLPPGTTALPPHLVRLDRDGAVIRERAARDDRAVQAVRLGGQTVILQVVDPATLVPPPPRAAGPFSDALGRFRGEVAPGARTRVSLSWISGRVESLVEDGSQVKAGDIVLSVYNPQMEADRERSERERRAAVQRVVAAAERRRRDLVRAKDDHATRRVAEATARLRLRRQLDEDVLARQDVLASIHQADDRMLAATARRQRLAALTAAQVDEVARADCELALAAVDRDRAALIAADWEVRNDWLVGRSLAATWSDAVEALARRDAELEEAAVQERINTLADRLAMEHAVEGDWWQRFFSTRRNLIAPVSGRILFQTGWNDQAQRSEKIGREFPVWGGMSVAEIVDEQTLRFVTELPEDRFPGLAIGTACEIEFEAAAGRPIQAKLSDLGRAFLLPRDRLVGDADDTVSNRRAFSAVVSFTPPDDLRKRLSTGAKGWIRLP